MNLLAVTPSASESYTDPPGFVLGLVGHGWEFYKTRENKLERAMLYGCLN